MEAWNIRWEIVFGVLDFDRLFAVFLMSNFDALTECDLLAQWLPLESLWKRQGYQARSKEEFKYLLGIQAFLSLGGAGENSRSENNLILHWLWRILTIILRFYSRQNEVRVEDVRIFLGTIDQHSYCVAAKRQISSVSAICIQEL